MLRKIWSGTEKKDSIVDQIHQSTYSFTTLETMILTYTAYYLSHGLLVKRKTVAAEMGMFFSTFQAKRY